MKPVQRRQKHRGRQLRRMATFLRSGERVYVERWPRIPTALAGAGSIRTETSGYRPAKGLSPMVGHTGTSKLRAAGIGMSVRADLLDREVNYEERASCRRCRKLHLSGIQRRGR